MNSPVVRWCERLVLASSVVAALACLLTGQPWRVTAGVVSGVLVGLLNFVGLRVIVTRLITLVVAHHEGSGARDDDDEARDGEAAPRPFGRLATLLLVKVLLVIATVWLLLNVLRLDAAGFGVGLTLVVAQLILVPFFMTLRGDPAGPDGAAGRDAPPRDAAARPRDAEET